MLEWIELGGAVVYPFESAHLGDFLRWMRRYSESYKRGIDLADASLYWLAVETGVIDMSTVDVTDFSRYRLPDGRHFTLLRATIAILSLPRQLRASAPIATHATPARPPRQAPVEFV